MKLSNFKKAPLLAASCAGFMITESLFAMGVSTLSLGAVMLVNSHELKMVKSSRDSSAATLCLQERVEQLRIATWRQITNADYLQENYFASLPKSIAPLEGSYTETITVSAYPDPTVTEPLVVEKSKGSDVKLVSCGAAMSSQRLARVDVDIKWVGKDRRERIRQMSTILNNGGVSRMNLPATGTAGGGTTSSADTDTTTTASTTTESSETTTTTTTTTTGARGRGNVGGKGGKG